MLIFLTGLVDAHPLLLYRKCFGFVILLELIWFSDHAAEVMSQGFSPVTPAELPFDVPLTPFTLDVCLVIGCFTAVCFVALDASSRTSVPLLVVYSYLRISDFTNWNNHYYLNMLELCLFCLTDCDRSVRHSSSCDSVREIERNAPSDIMDTSESLLNYPVACSRSELPEEPRPAAPSWYYFTFRFLLCWTYFMAGVSKISEAWLSGYITETMLHNWDFPLVNLLVPEHITLLQLAQLLAWGGLLLDLLGGPILLVAATLGWRLATYTCLAMFVPFHLTNLLWLFQSIQFFPLNMLSTTLLFLPTTLTTVTAKRRPTFSWPVAALALVIVIGQAALSTRRFFLFGNASVWEINEITEVTALHHEFSWRMKSKAIRDSIPHPLLEEKHLKLGYFTAANWETGAKSILSTYSLMPRGTTPHRSLIVQFARRKMAQGKATAYQLGSNHWLAVCGRPFQQVIDSRFDLLDSREQAWPPPLMPFPLPNRWRDIIEEDLQSWAPFNNEYFTLSRESGLVANPLLHLSSEVQPLYLRCLLDAQITVLLRDIGAVNCNGPDGIVELKSGKRWEISGQGIWSLVWRMKWIHPNAVVRFT